jgi:hypothetical protein
LEPCSVFSRSSCARTCLDGGAGHFLANAHDRAVTHKRGGGKHVLSLDATDAEGRYLGEPADELTPEGPFQRRWALAPLQHVMARLRAESEEAGITVREPLRQAVRHASRPFHYGLVPILPRRS